MNDLEKAWKQAKDYALSLPQKQIPKGILTFDFDTFEYHNLEKDGETATFPLAGLPWYVGLFGYLAGCHEAVSGAASPVDIEAAERRADLHGALKETRYEGHDLEVYLVRPLTMPPALVKAQQSLDRAVEKACGKEFTSDADRVAHLFCLYQTLTEGLLARKTRRKNL